MAYGQDRLVDDRRVGQALKSVRLRLGLTQDELGIAAGVSRFVVGRIERGRLDRIALQTLRSVATALDVDVDLVVRWRGGELGRMINARHAAMHEALALQMATVPDWRYEPEVSFSIFGERRDRCTCLACAVAMPARDRAQERAGRHQRPHGHDGPAAPPRRRDRREARLARCIRLVLGGGRRRADEPPSACSTPDDASREVPGRRTHRQAMAPTACRLGAGPQLHAC